MSSVLVESPATTGQLCFPWTTAGPDETVGLEQTLDRTAPEIVEVPGAVPHDSAVGLDKLGTSNGRHLGDKPAEGFPAQSLLPRAGQPVRIGPVMIKLLRRYGISDQEIDEGLARYAKRTQQSLAS